MEKEKFLKGNFDWYWWVSERWLVDGDERGWNLIIDAWNLISRFNSSFKGIKNYYNNWKKGNSWRETLLIDIDEGWLMDDERE